MLKIRIRNVKINSKEGVGMSESGMNQLQFINHLHQPTQLTMWQNEKTSWFSEIPQIPSKNSRYLHKNFIKLRRTNRPDISFYPKISCSKFCIRPIPTV